MAAAPVSHDFACDMRLAVPNADALHELPPPRQVWVAVAHAFAVAATQKWF